MSDDTRSVPRPADNVHCNTCVEAGNWRVRFQDSELSGVLNTTKLEKIASTRGERPDTSRDLNLQPYDDRAAFALAHKRCLRGTSEFFCRHYCQFKERNL